MNGIYIFVVDRGFVIVGQAELHPELAFTWQVRGRTVRRWGTKHGLAELCGGPTPETVLDDLCDRWIPFRSIIEMLRVTDQGVQAWESYLTLEVPAS